MAFGLNKPSTRRSQIRAGDREPMAQWWARRRADGTIVSVWIAVCFAIGAAAILSVRGHVIAYRPGQYAPSDVVARVNFAYHDQDAYANEQALARTAQPRVYVERPSVWGQIEQKFLELPRRVAGLDEPELPEDVRGILRGAALTRVREFTDEARRKDWEQSVHTYADALRQLNLVVLQDDQRVKEVDRSIELTDRGTIPVNMTYSPRMKDELAARIQKLAEASFAGALQPTVVQLTLRWLTATHELNDAATVSAQNRAAMAVPRSRGDKLYEVNQVIVPAGQVREKDWSILKAEAAAFAEQQDRGGWLALLGTALLVSLMTLVLCTYVVQFQPRIVRNHSRAIAVVALMLSMLLTAQLAGISSQPIYVFGMAPTLLVAMILAIVYDRRFAAGIGTVHALLVTFALNESVGFTMILLAGVITACVLLDEVRTRSKLVEVGGAAAIAMIIATAAVSMLRADPLAYALRNCMHAGAAGLGVGFIVLGILPFIEKSFRITTAMTLLELADVSHPLLRRIATEAPGTWNHSLQVAAMSEEAAEAIGANSLLCRVGSYYHDCGKINKPEYFVENQQDGVNRHINLTPSVSILIIIAHVKDGMGLARHHRLPSSLFPFIQQHHGTTRVEFFYDQAIRRTDPEKEEVSEVQYRYPGPKPKTKEIAIVMLADCCESAARTMQDPTPPRIEALVDDLALKRLLDGQFDECDLTMRDLELVKRSLIKSLLGIYHGRIAYPTTQVEQPPQADQSSEQPRDVKTA